MNHLPFPQWRARWLLTMAPCLLLGADIQPSARNARRLPDIEPLTKPGNPTTMTAVGTSVAQEDVSVASPSPTQSTAKLDKFIVSAGRTAQNAAAISSPVETITADEISRSNFATDLQEALRKLVPQFMGGANAGAESGGSGSGRMGGGSSLALRNLPTLVLINGRRAAVSPVSAHHSGRQFVDLNVIPLSAVGSVEILRDGGLAIHGTGAVGGVVDIATSRTLAGGRLGGVYEIAPRNGGWERRGANFAFGHDGARTRFVIAGGWSRQDPLWKSQRGFSNPTFNSTNFNGSISVGPHYFVLNPVLAAPPMAMPKPAVAFPMTDVPDAPGGRPYFGPVGSDAVYWGKRDAGGAIVGFPAAELSQGSSPEASRVAFNVANFVTLLQRRESHGGIIAFEHTFQEGMAAFADVLAARIATQSQGAPQGFGNNFLASNPNNPFNTTTAANSRVLSSPRPAAWDTEYGRLVGGLRGRFGDRFRFESALNLNRSRQTYFSSGQIDLLNMFAAVNEGRLNLFQRNVPPAELTAAEFVGVATGTFDSTLRGWDGKVSFEALRMPGGVVQWTTGAEHRREKLNGIADQNTVPDSRTGRINWGGGQPLLPFKATRTVSSVFAALRAPIIAPAGENRSRQSVDVTFDARGERYSDMSSPLAAAAGVRWMPSDGEFTVRTTIGRFFNAPTLYQTSGPPLAGTAGVELVGIDGRPASGPAHRQDASNAALRPERARNWSAGVVYAPRRWKEASMEFNYVRVLQRGVIRRRPPRDVLQDVEVRGSESRYVAGHAGSLPGYDVRVDTGFAENGAKVTAPGQIATRVESVFLTNPTVNLGNREVEALDAAINYPFRWSADRSLNTSLRVAYTASDVFMGLETAGRATPANGTIPRWSVVTMVAYRHGGWQFNVLHRAIASVFSELEQYETGTFQSFDVGLKHRFGGPAPVLLRKIELSITVKNIRDAGPRRAPGSFSGATADLGVFDPLGRTWVVSTDYRF